MNLLIDTHILLWWLSDHTHLSKKSIQLIADTRNNLYLSTAALWEMAIKESLGKLELPQYFEFTLVSQGFQDLPVKKAHVRQLSQLPLIHRDPFDRIQIAQAITEGMTLISADTVFKQYPVTVIS